jgi:hypothetical protein
MSYLEVKNQSPSDFEGKFSGKRVLVIANGPSTRALVPYKGRIRDVFDCVIIVNKGFIEFDSVADFHVIAEKASVGNKMNTIYKELNSGQYRVDLPRLINWKGIGLYDNRYNIRKIQRCKYDSGLNLHKYKSEQGEGLFIGPTGSAGLSLGTVIVCSLHWAGILGAKDVFLIGGDLMFKDEFDHFYNDKLYRGGEMRSKDFDPIVTVELGGKKYQTLRYYYESAKYISSALNGVFAGLNVCDLSDGLIETYNKASVEDLFRL